MKLAIKILTLSLLYFSSSCAYFGNSKEVNLSIMSNPSGADVFIEGRNYGKTPLNVKIIPKGYVATITKEGYGSAILNLDTWQVAKRNSKEGDGKRCLADAVGTMLVLPYFSYNSVYCRDFKQPEYFVNIPYLGQSAGRVNGKGVALDAPAMADYYYKQDMMRFQNQQAQ